MVDILITILLLIVILAVISYALQFVPLDPGLRNLISLVIAVIFLIWLIYALLGHGTLMPWRGR